MFLGFDIGGSSIKAVAMKNKKVIYSKIEPLPVSYKGFLALILEIKNNFEKEVKMKAIGAGFAFPGPLDKNREKIVYAPNIGYLSGKPILKTLKKVLNLSRVKIEHDIHCFLLAEKEMGKIKKYKNVFYLTLGTGIGGAFMIDGKIIIGAHGSAGELGYMVLDEKNNKVLEDLGANKFIQTELNIESQEAKKLAEEGNKKVIETFSKMGKNLGVGIANIINIMDPEIIIINGGLLAAKKYFSFEMEKTVQRLVLSKEARKTKIVFSELGRLAGAMGAGIKASSLGAQSFL